MSITAEIIAVGTELIVGETVNSNATWLSNELANIGVDVYYHSAVGDNPKRIQEVFELALKRSSFIIFTGGLGPTDDDLTVKTIADYFEAPLFRDETIAQNLEKYFIARGMPMSKTNLKQADKPEAAEFLDNPVGTAPGVFWDVSDPSSKKLRTTDKKWLVFLPGVPMEMKTIWQESVVPKLLQQLGIKEQLYTESLLFFGIGESMLAEKLRDLMEQSSPSVASYVGEAEVRIRLAVKASSPEEAKQKLSSTKTAVLSRVGEYCFGEGDTSLEQEIIQLLQQQNKKVAVAESCTGGLISHRLTNISGSSACVDLNITSYANWAKQEFLEVGAKIIEDEGAVSEVVAIEMAKGIQQLAKTNFGLGITGIAGPTGGTDEKPVGLAYAAIALPNGITQVKKIVVNPRYPRVKIKYWFSQYALFELWQALKVETT